MAGKKQWPTDIEDEESFDPAVEWFRTRTAMTRGQVDELAVEMRRQVFFITGLSDLAAIERVQSSLQRALRDGRTFEEWQASARADLSGPEFTDARLRTIYRTNLQNAFAAGRYAELTSDVAKKRRPYWRFSAVRDGRTTSTCAASHGTVLHMDHPWWKTHVPPLHFNCRSTIVPLTEAEAKKRGVTGRPPEQKAALGFGHPPDPVPAEAKKKLTPSEEADRREKQEKVRAEEEKADAASSKAAKTRREARRAVKEAERAQKSVQEAAPEELAEAKKRAEELAQEAKAASREATAATKAAEEADAKARKIGEGVPRNWEPTKESLVRRFGKQLAAPFIAAWEALEGHWREFKRGELFRALADEAGSVPTKSPAEQAWDKAVEQAAREGKSWQRLNDKELKVAIAAKVLPKDTSNAVQPKKKHIATRDGKWRPEGNFCSFVTEDRREEVEKDVEAIRKGKLKPKWIETKDAQGRDLFTAGYVGEGGIHYRVGIENGAPHLFISSGEGVHSFNDKEIKVIKDFDKKKLSLEKAIKVYPKYKEALEIFIEVTKGK